MRKRAAIIGGEYVEQTIDLGPSRTTSHADRPFGKHRGAASLVEGTTQLVPASVPVRPIALQHCWLCDGMSSQPLCLGCESILTHGREV